MSNLSKLLIRGNALAQRGDLVGARTEFEKAARDHARRAEPWISLSAIHGMQGDFAAALRCGRKAVALAPESLQGWVNLANAARSLGDLPQAAEAFQRACNLPGCPADIALELGLTLAQLGKWQGAEKPLRDYLARHPGHREATLALAKTLTMNGKPETAASILENYCRQRPGDAGALHHLGIVYLDLGRSQDVRRICDQIMRESTDASHALFLKAALLIYEARYAEAHDVCEQLKKTHPDDPELLALLAHICLQEGSIDSAIAYSRAALTINPRCLTALINLSAAFLSRDVAESRRVMEEAVAIAPHNVSVLALKGRVLESLGDKQGAWECVQEAIDSGSIDTGAALVAARVAPAVGRMEQAIELLERLVTRPEISAGDKRVLHFALVNVCDKAKQYDRAFGHAVIANRIKNAAHDHNAYTADLNRLKTVYSSAALASLPRSRIFSELPVFIVGMPRSGTSLLEQILSCHSKVHARGETADVGKLTEAIPYFPDGARNLTQEKLDALASAYLERLREMAPSATRVTDKMPGNYRHLGIISQVFPGARILHCQRDPRDVCLSNYFTEFAIGHTHTYNLESLAQVYKAYRELMEHWKAILPIPILDVQYEELVAEPRAWVERILDFCGLEWEEACLDFHKSKRHVVTASYDQVRQPLYKSSVARWKHYERHLEPVCRILGLNDGS